LALAQTFTPTLRAALRLAIGAALAIAMVFWSGRGDRVFLAVIAVVMFATESRSLPWSALLSQFAAGVVGILTALVLFQLADGWLMLSVVLLVVALLLEVLRLQSGRSLALLLAWGVLVMDPQRAFNIATVFDLALSFMIGLLSARFATALIWPQRPGSRVAALDRNLSARLIDQVSRVQQWLVQGGTRPPQLASAEFLPVVLELQHPPSRQLGLLWRQILRHWLLLEPQLLALSAPLSHPAGQLLLRRLDGFKAVLTTAAVAGDAKAAVVPTPQESTSWRIDLTSELIALAIGQQLDALDQLLHSQRLLRGSGRLVRQRS
jgi:hypothetical protein